MAINAGEGGPRRTVTSIGLAKRGRREGGQPEGAKARRPERRVSGAGQSAVYWYNHVSDRV